MSDREYTEQEIVDVLPHPLTLSPEAREAFKGKTAKELREYAIEILDNTKESKETKVLNDDEFLKVWCNMTFREAVKYPNIKRAKKIISKFISRGGDDTDKHVTKEMGKELREIDSTIERVCKEKVKFTEDAYKTSIANGFKGVIITETTEKFKITFFATPTHDHEGIVSVIR